MTHQSFQVTISDYIAHVAFNRPHKANSLDIPDWEEMRQIFQTLNTDPEVRVVVLSGEGKHFCAGIDLNALMSVQQKAQMDCEARKREVLRDFILNLQDCISSIEKCKKPVLAAIHNGCIGGGVDIVSACDMRYCTTDAYFTIKEIDLGLVADIGTLQRLPTLIPAGMMAEMAYTGRKVYGPEALRIGLVNKTYETKEEMMNKVMEIAATIAAKSPLCIRGTKEMILYKRDHTVADSLEQVALYNSAMLLSRDLNEAFMANLQKRNPVFEEKK